MISRAISRGCRTFILVQLSAALFSCGGESAEQRLKQTPQEQHKDAIIIDGFGDTTGPVGVPMLPGPSPYLYTDVINQSYLYVGYRDLSDNVLQLPYGKGPTTVVNTIDPNGNNSVFRLTSGLVIAMAYEGSASQNPSGLSQFYLIGSGTSPTTHARPAVSSWGHSGYQRYDVFAFDGIGIKWTTGTGTAYNSVSWNSWSSVPNAPTVHSTSNNGAASWGEGSLALAVADAAGHLRVATYSTTGGWSTWADLGADGSYSFTDAAIAAKPINNGYQLDVVALSTNPAGPYWGRRYTSTMGTWSGWYLCDQGWASAPAIGYDVNGLSKVWGNDANHYLWGNEVCYPH